MGKQAVADFAAGIKDLIAIKQAREKEVAVGLHAAVQFGGIVQGIIGVDKLAEVGGPKVNGMAEAARGEVERYVHRCSLLFRRIVARQQGIGLARSAHWLICSDTMAWMHTGVQTRPLVSSVLQTPLGRITLSGYIRDSTGVPFEKVRVFGSYALVYVLHGGGRYTDERGAERRVSAGDLILVFPELAHAYGPAAGESWDEIFIAFDGPVFDLWRRHGLIGEQRPVLRLMPVEYWRGKWESVVTDGPAGTTPTPLVAIGRLLDALAEAVDANGPEHLADEDRQWLEQAKALLEPPVRGEGAALERVAEELGMSYVAFRKRFARVAGLPPGHYRMRRVIDRACQLLAGDPRLANKQLARMCGFANEYHFSRRFKQTMGMSPRQFRSQVMMGVEG